MKIILIRHGKTAGNLEGRYIGRTDEPLCPEGIAGLKEKTYPVAEKVICSPMRRCVETAGLLYPGLKTELEPGLRECDFGEFEGRNYQELNGNPAYQKWIDSGGALAFPGGESRETFSRRCVAGFCRALAFCREKSVAFVVHGGTIMAIMEAFARPTGEYFDFQVKNGGGYVGRFDGSAITQWEELE